MQTCSSRQDCCCHLCAGSGTTPTGSTVAQGMSQQDAQGLGSAASGAEKVVHAQAGSGHGGSAGILGAAAGSAQGFAAAAAGSDSRAGEAVSQAAQAARLTSAAKGTKRSREAAEPPFTNKRARLAVAPEPGQEVCAASIQAGAGAMQWEADSADAAAVPAMGSRAALAFHAAVPAGAGGEASRGAALPAGPGMLERGQ